MNEQGYEFRPIRIEDDAAIMSKCTIIADVGRRAFIAANAVVTRPIDAYTVAAGVPAKPIEYFGPSGTRPSELEVDSEARPDGGPVSRARPED